MISAPPRPQLVVRKKPVLARRSTWIAAGAVALAGILVAVFVAVGNIGEANALKRERAAVQQYVNLVQAQLPAAAQQLGPTNYLLYPTVEQDLIDLAAGTLTPADARTKGADLQAGATTSADGIDAVRIRDVIPEEFTETRLALTDAQFLMMQGFTVYQRVGALMVAAADDSGDSRQAIVDEAGVLATDAGNLFDRGWAGLVNVETRVGIPVSQQPIFPPATEPPPPPSPTASPSASPTASPTTTPSESPSGSPTESPTASPTDSASPTGSASPTDSASPTASASPTG